MEDRGENFVVTHLHHPAGQNLRVTGRGPRSWSKARGQKLYNVLSRKLCVEHGLCSFSSRKHTTQKQIWREGIFP